MIGPKGFVGAIFFLAGTFFSIAGLWNLAEINVIAANGKSTTGQVYHISRHHSSGGLRGGGGTSYRHWVSFTDEKGTEHQFRNRLGGAKGFWDVGETVEVIYDPSDPDNAVINSFWGRFGFAFFTLFALPFAFLGAWLFQSDRRESSIFDR